MPEVTYYHSTPDTNLSSIRQQGLLPTGPFGTFLGTTQIEALGQAKDEHLNHNIFAVLSIRRKNLDSEFLHDSEEEIELGEITYTKRIPPEHIKLVATYTVT